MSDFARKREEYINNWPNTNLFPVETAYQTKCDVFFSTYKKNIFRPMQIWQCDDDEYQRDISHIIQSLEMMPTYPNNAFLFIFSGFDYFGKRIYSEAQTTKNLKTTAEEIAILSTQNSDVKKTIQMLYEIMPFRASNYLYKRIIGNSKIAGRISSDKNGISIPQYSAIIDSINRKYSSLTNENIRNASMFYKHLLKETSIVLDTSPVVIPEELKIRFVLLGLIYSMRNDFAHGSAMASTKSSKTTMARYSMHFYCFVVTYTIFMILLVLHSGLTESEKNKYYMELYSTTKENVESFKLLFGNYTSR